MSQENQPLSLNNLALGLIIGFLLPFIVFMLYFLFRINGTEFSMYLRFLVESEKLVHVISLSTFPNLVPFLLFVNSERYRSGRGVLGATVVVGIIIFIIKIL